MKERIEEKLDGHDYDRGELEALTATVENTASLLTFVCMELLREGVISEGDLENALNKCPYW